MLIALFDLDQLVFNYAEKLKTNNEDTVFHHFKERVMYTLRGTGCTRYRLFVGGSKPTFRKSICSDYKANRQFDAEAQSLRDVIRDYAVDELGAIQCIGYEADDALAMEQNSNTILVHDDKDMLQVPGSHYKMGYWREGECLRKPEFLEITYLEGLRNVYAQSLIGDTTDNITGVQGIGKVKAKTIVEQCNSEFELMEACISYYGYDEDRFYKNMSLLWLWRNFGEDYMRRNFVQNVILDDDIPF